MIPYLFIISLCTLSLTVSAEPVFFRGTINSSIPVSVEVDPWTPNAWSHLSYDQKGTDAIRLQASPQGAESRNFEWHEEIYSRERGNTKMTGILTGIMSQDGKRAEGFWRSPDGKRKWPLILERLATIGQLTHPDLDVKCTYPIFEDSRYEKLNQLLLADAQKAFDQNTKRVLEVKKELQTTTMPPDIVNQVFNWRFTSIESLRPNLVGLSHIFSSFEGGAHPNTFMGGANYIIEKNGLPRAVGLWSLLSRSDDHVHTLSRMILDDLRRQKASLVTRGEIKGFEKELKSDQLSFVVVPAGIAFLFSPYEVGTYAEGDFRAVITHKQLAAMIRADGPLTP